MNRWLIASILLTLVAFGCPLFLYYGWPDLLLERIPTHSNITGEVDQWTPRKQILPLWLLMPGVMGFLVGLSLLVPWMSPQGFEVNRFRGTFSFLMAVCVAVLGYIHMLFVLGGVRGVQFDLTRWLLGGVSLFFVLLGNRLDKVQRNFFMGVRTPWTLASETVWIQTHRMTAWLWVAVGLMMSIAAFAGLSVWVWLVGLAIMALSPVVYSLWLYKRLEKQGRLSSTL